MSQDVIEKFAKTWEERALLYFCLVNIDFFYTMLSTVSINDFLDPDHQMLYSLLMGLHSDGVSKFDLPIVVKEAKHLGVLEQIGGVDYIKSLYKMKLSYDNFKVVLEAVLSASAKYSLFNKLTDGCSLLLNNESIKVDDVVGKIESSILDLSATTKRLTEPQDLSSGVVDLINYRKETYIPLSGISTGFSILDKQIDGLVPGTLNVLAARKKMGKSAVLTNIALHVAYTQKIPVLYVDTEMSYDEFRDRCLASLSFIKERVVKHGGYDQEQYSRLIKSAKALESNLLFHERMPGFTVDRLVALYKKFKYKYNIGLAVFDYIKEPDSTSVERNRKEYQILGDVTTRLKDLAGTLKIPFLTAVQLNRDLDIADSDRVARFADVIAFWSSKSAKEVEEHGFAGGSHKLVIKDTRRGGTTDDRGIGYYFFKDTLKVKEAPPEKQLIDFTKEVINDGAAEELYAEEELV